MAQALYPIEKIGQLAGRRMKDRIAALRDTFAPPGERPPFTTHKTRGDAVGWWREHRYDDLGRQVLARYTPRQVMELDVELARAVEAERLDVGVDDGLS